MSHGLALRTLARRTIGLTLVLAAPRLGSGQCLDFASGFGVPGDGLDGVVRSLVVFDDRSGPKLYAGGYFYNVGGGTHVARWDGTNWTAIAPGAAYGSLNALCVWNDGFGDALYAAGGFDTIGGVAARNIAKWDGATWSALGSQLGAGDCYALTVFDDGNGAKLCVGGGFTTAGGSAANRVALWDGSTWSALGSGLSTSVLCLGVFDIGAGPRLFAGSYGNGYVTQWNGSSWTQLGSGFAGGGYVAAMAVHDAGGGARLYVGGSLVLNGNYADVAWWNGSSWNRIPPFLGGATVLSLASFDDDGTGPKLFAGGTFQYVASSPDGRVAKRIGSTWLPLSSGIDAAVTGDAVRAMATYDDGSGSRLFLGGQFKAAGGYPSWGIARWGEACTAPWIEQQPVDVVLTYVPDDPVLTLQVVARGTAPLSYQWYRNDVALVDDGRVTGATSDTLRVYYWSLNDEGEYYATVANPFGQIESDHVDVTVPLVGVSGLPVVVSKILYPPEQVPNLPPGHSYSNFLGHRVSAAGEIAFTSDITGPSIHGRSLNLWESGALRVLHHADQQAPGCEPGAVFMTGSGSQYAFRSYAIASGGRVSFLSGLNGSAIPGASPGIWYRDVSGTVLVARERFPAPGGSSGETWRSLSGPMMSDSGTLALTAWIYDASGVYQGAGLWTWTPAGGHQLELRTRTTPPGSSATLYSLQESPAMFNDSGAVVVLGELNSQTGYNWSYYPRDTAIWKGQPGALQLIAQSGDPAPGMPPGTNLERMESAAIENDGDVVFFTWVAGPNNFRSCGVYRWTSAGVVPIVLRGDPAPGVNSASLFWAPQIRAVNSNGDVIVYDTIQSNCPSPCPDKGLWYVHAGVPRLIAANRMDPLPAAPPDSRATSFSTPAMNAGGDAIFPVYFEVNPGGAGCYGWTSSRGLFPIAVAGMQFEISPGQHKTVSFAGIGGGASGVSGVLDSKGLNDGGLAVMSVMFSDSTKGLWYAQFQYLAGLQFGPATSFCAGDGSGTPCPCGNTGTVGRGCTNSSGDGALLTASGTVRVGADDLAFAAVGLPANVPSLLFQGSSTLGGGSGIPFQDGLRCAGGTVRRLELQFADDDGVAAWGPGFAAQGQWLAGETVHFQVWYRDAAGSPCGKFTNLSNGLMVTFTP